MKHYTLTEIHQQIRVNVDCLFCPTTETVVVPKQDYQRWQQGMLAQQAMPTLTPIARDVLITNMCTACLNGLYEDKGETA